jgi:hypothetical protein
MWAFPDSDIYADTSSVSHPDSTDFYPDTHRYRHHQSISSFELYTGNAINYPSSQTMSHLRYHVAFQCSELSKDLKTALKLPLVRIKGVWHTMRPAAEQQPD